MRILFCALAYLFVVLTPPASADDLCSHALPPPPASISRAFLLDLLKTYRAKVPSERLSKAMARVEMGCLTSTESCLIGQSGIVMPLGDSEFFEVLRQVLYLPHWSASGPATRATICALRSNLPARYGLLRNDPDPRLDSYLESYIGNSFRPAAPAVAPPSRPALDADDLRYANYLIRIHSERPGRDTAWFAHQCGMVQDKLFEARKTIYGRADLARLNNVTCVRDETIAGYARLRESKAYKYEVSIDESAKGELTLSIENLAPKDDTELGRTTLPYAVSGSPERVEAFLGRELERRALLFVPRGQETIKAQALKFVAPQLSSLVSYDADGRWIDRRTRRELLVDDALKLFQKENPESRHWFRMLSETFGFLGAQAGVFYLECQYEWKVLSLPGYVRGTWDFGLGDIGQKFTGLKGVGIDDNAFSANAHGHPVDGALYYAFARVNGFSIPESFLASALASGLWEYFGELRQQASINDLTVTPTAGMAAAESVINIGAFAGKGDPSRLLPRIFQYVFNVLEPFHDALDRNHTRRERDYDRFGFPAELEHSFEAAFRAGGELRGGQFHDVGQLRLDLEVINIPNSDQPGSERKIFYDGNLSRIVLGFGFDNAGTQEIKGTFTSVLAGFYKKKIELDQACLRNGGRVDDCRKGYRLVTGLKTRFDYETRQGAALGAQDPEELMAICTVMGQTLDVTFFYKGLKIRAIADAYGDYAMIRNFAVDKVPVDKYQDEIQSSILVADRYYHGLGMTASGELDLEYRNFDLKTSTMYDYIHSAFDGFDRYRYQGHNPSDAEQDQRVQVNVSAGYQFLSGLLEVAAEYSHTDRWGETTFIESGTPTPYRNDLTADIVTANLKVKF